MAKTVRMPNALQALEWLSRVDKLDARLDRIERLSELAKRRLRFWRSVGVIAAGAALVLAFALWESLKRCPCEFPSPHAEGLEANSG